MYVPSPNVKEHKVSKQNVLQKLDVVWAIDATSSRYNKNIDTAKGKKGEWVRKKNETNSPPPPTIRHDCRTSSNYYWGIRRHNQV